VEASIDVLKDVIGISDTMTAEEAVEFRIAIERVVSECRLAIDMLNMHLLTVLEQDVIRDRRRFYVTRKKDSERFDHDAIGGGVVRFALEQVIDTETGEIVEFDKEVAVREAVHAMRNIYVSDSTKAKVNQLDRYGIPRDPKTDSKSVRTWTPGEKVVVDVPAGGQEEII
jgi:hypothetical protein